MIEEEVDETEAGMTEATKEDEVHTVIVIARPIKKIIIVMKGTMIGRDGVTSHPTNQIRQIQQTTSTIVEGRHNGRDRSATGPRCI